MVQEKRNRLTGANTKKEENQINRQGFHIIYFCCCRSDKVADTETGLFSHCYHPWPSAAEEWHSLSFAWWVMYEELGRAYALVLWQTKWKFFFLTHKTRINIWIRLDEGVLKKGINHLRVLRERICVYMCVCLHVGCILNKRTQICGACACVCVRVRAHE